MVLLQLQQLLLLGLQAQLLWRRLPQLKEHHLLQQQLLQLDLLVAQLLQV
jgi:hypothetical protein